MRMSAELVWGLGLAMPALALGLFGMDQAHESSHAALVAFTQPESDWQAVRQVLEDRCLECHGGHDRESGLSFADRTTFAQGGDRGPVVESENLEASRLLHVIGYSDPNLAMPPAGQLPEDEYKILESWVLAGSPWPESEAGVLADPAMHPIKRRTIEADSDWWAYQPLTKPEVPSFQDDAWNAHPIDAFVRAKLEDKGIAPVGLATPEELIRRATYDLIGLPPTPEEVRAFLAAYEMDADGAWNALIERLLASPSYGEHWARHWLDQVRYAETNGYETDGKKTNIWRYRDWIIRAFNDDMPYDRFLVEQLAGDELHWNEPESPESDAAKIATGYYRLGVWDDGPADSVQAKADELADIVDTTGQVALGMTLGCARCHDHKADPITQKDYFAFTAYFNNIVSFGGEGTIKQGGGTTEDIPDAPVPGQKTKLEVEMELMKLRLLLLGQVQEIGWAPVEGETILPDARTDGATWRYFEGEPPEDYRLQAFDDSEWKEGKGGFGAKGTPGAIVGTDWQSKRLTIRTDFRLGEIPNGAILSIHHDEDAEIFINNVHVATLDGYTTGYTDLQLGQEAMNSLVVGSNTIAISCKQTIGGQYIDAGLREGWLDTPEAWATRVLLTPMEELANEAAIEAKVTANEITRVEATPVAEPYAALVVKERGSEAPVQHVHGRGSAHAPGEIVAPAVPAVLRWVGEPDEVSLPEGAESTGRRLALAEWLVDEGSFVTARVMANRLWQFHFGRGLCRTSGDFGRFGMKPTHPELLDYLAARLIENGWSMKAMHREIMSSRFYRTSSVASAELAAGDGNNEWYGRTDARRLTAEQYRDAVLSVSGLRTEKMYGPSVFPPMPREVLETSSRPDQAWGTSTEEDANRRSIYVFSKRSLRVPILENLDQPSPDTPCPVRFPTNVPTQALITLNSDFMNDAADAFAGRVLSQTDTLEDAIDLAIELALSRKASDEERSILVSFANELMIEDKLDERGAMQVCCLMLMNTNEFMWVD